MAIILIIAEVAHYLLTQVVRSGETATNKRGFSQFCNFIKHSLRNCYFHIVVTCVKLINLLGIFPHGILTLLGSWGSCDVMLPLTVPLYYCEHLLY